MRVLIVTPSFGGKDGISCLSRRVAVALAELGADIEVWSLMDEDGAGAAVSGTPIPVRGARGDKIRIVAWAVTSFSRDCRDLAVVVMHAHLAPLSLPFRGRGARVFHVLHGIEVWKPLTALQAWAFRAAERLLCVSAHSERVFAEANPGFERTMVCHSGIPDRPRAGELGDDGFALIVGRMASSERYKGHDVLLEVWPDVVAGAPHAALVVVGDGDDRDRLMRKAETLGLSGSIRFTGSVPDEELDRLFRRCSFFVMPSVNEGFGLVFLEAMRASKPCIGGPGAASEIIEDGATGFVVDPGDRGAMVRALVELFSQPERRIDMGARGRERFERRFTEEHFRERLRAALEIGALGRADAAQPVSTSESLRNRASTSTSRR